jgi:hypothetical protein
VLGAPGSVEINLANENNAALAVLDACAQITVADPKRRAEQGLERNAAREWLLGYSPDFSLVCDLAGFDESATGEHGGLQARAGGFPATRRQRCPWPQRASPSKS